MTYPFDATIFENKLRGFRDSKGNITNISSNDINIFNTYDQYNNLTEQIIESNN